LFQKRKKTWRRSPSFWDGIGVKRKKKKKLQTDRQIRDRRLLFEEKPAK